MMNYPETIALIRQLIEEKGLDTYAVMCAAMEMDKDTAWSTSSINRTAVLDIINSEREAEGLKPLDAIPDDSWETFKNYQFDGHRLVSGDDAARAEVVMTCLGHLVKK